MLGEQGLHTRPVLVFRSVLGLRPELFQARDLVRLLTAEKKKKKNQQHGKEG